MERRVVFKSNIDRTIRAEKHAEQDKGEKHRDAELVRDTVQKYTGKDHNGRQEQERSHRRSPFTTSGKVVFFIVSERKRKGQWWKPFHAYCHFERSREILLADR